MDQHIDTRLDWFVLGNKQEFDLDYEETFAPVPKMITVRTIIAIVASKSWQIH